MPTTDAGRSVWLLTDDRPGNRTQAIGVARALGWRVEEKRLAFNELSKRSTPRLGATLETLEPAARAAIAPPWPDLVLAAGRRTVPVARHVKAASDGRTRVVLIGRKTPGAAADLTIRCSYFRQVPEPGLLELALPPTKVDAAALAAALEEPDPLEGLPGPRVALLVGGPTAAHGFDAAVAGRMAREIVGAAAAAAASLAVVTSRRTPPEATLAIRPEAEKAGVPLRLLEWRAGEAQNPFLAVLARSDALVVTGESESMLAEAVAAGKPLTIYALPARPLGLKARIRGAIAARALGRGPFAALASRIMSEGWVTPRRDLADFHRSIAANGWGAIFSGRLNLSEPAPRDEDDQIRRRIEALF